MIYGYPNTGVYREIEEGPLFLSAMLTRGGFSDGWVPPDVRSGIEDHVGEIHDEGDMRRVIHELYLRR